MARTATRIRSQSWGKRGAKPKDWQLGDIVTYLPKKMGTAGGIGLVPRRVVCKVVGKTGRGAITYYKLRSNEGVLQARPRAAELDKAVPAAAATINFAGVETDGVPAVTDGDRRWCGAAWQRRRAAAASSAAPAAPASSAARTAAASAAASARLVPTAATTDASVAAAPAGHLLRCMPTPAFCSFPSFSWLFPTAL